MKCASLKAQDKLDNIKVRDVFEMWYRIFQLHFLLWVRMYKKKGQVWRSEFSFSQSLATYIADSRKLLHLSRNFFLIWKTLWRTGEMHLNRDFNIFSCISCLFWLKLWSGWFGITENKIGISLMSKYFFERNLVSRGVQEENSCLCCK